MSGKGDKIGFLEERNSSSLFTIGFQRALLSPYSRHLPIHNNWLKSRHLAQDGPVTVPGPAPTDNW